MDARDRRYRWQAVLGLVAAVALCAAGTASAADEQVGAWQPHKLTLYFLGLSTTYSCDGLQRVLTYLLTQVGAKLNAPVVPQPCSAGFGTPQKLSQAELNFSSLKPAGAGEADTVPGVWRHVDLSPQHSGTLHGADCELVNEFREHVLSLFAARDMKNHLTCIPFQEQSLVYDLSFDVYQPVNPPPLPPGATD